MPEMRTWLAMRNQIHAQLERLTCEGVEAGTRRSRVIKTLVEVTIYPTGRGARKFNSATVEIGPKPGME